MKNYTKYFFVFLLNVGLIFSFLNLSAQSIKHLSGTVKDNLSDEPVPSASIKFYKRQITIDAAGNVSILPIKAATLFQTIQTNALGQYQYDLPLSGSNNEFYFIEISANQYSPSCKLFYNPVIESSNSLDFLLQYANLSASQMEVLLEKEWNEKVAKGITGTDASPANETYDPNNLPSNPSRASCSFQVPAQVHVNNLTNGDNAHQCSSSYQGFTGNMSFDELLAGILRAEFSIGSAQPEAMKAHAIASRTYAQYNINTGASANCGHAYSNDIANYPVYMNAVNATSGMVMTYNGTGNVIKAYYSARCNGDYTQNSYEAVNAPTNNCQHTGYGYLPYCLSKPCSGHSNCSQYSGSCPTSGECPCCNVPVSTSGALGYIYGHGAGLCQRGAVRYASNFSYTYDQILNAYYTDICITNPANSITNTLDCSSAQTLQCGQVYTFPASYTQSNVTTYGCNNWTETGPERVHKITATQNGLLTATISNYTGDLDVFILTDCDPSTCVGSVGSYYATFNNAVAGHTYYVVVDADDGSTSGYSIQMTCASNAPQTLNCNSAIPLTLGQPYSGSTANGSSSVSQYGCNTWNESGPEVVHSITLPTAGVLTCTLSGMSSDLDLFILDACNQTSCINAIDNSGTTTLSAGTYYLVVDGYNGAAGSYTLTVNFNNQNNGGGNTLVCSNAVNITCGQQYNGTTTGASANINFYPCQSSWTESGPEVVHQITVSNIGTLTATLSNLNGIDLDVFILNSCDPNSCVAFGNTTATLTNVAPGTYYVVVDGSLGAGGSYSLNVNCTNTNNSTALDCNNAQAISCGQSYNGTTVGGNNGVSAYSGTTWAETGPERVYSITTVAPGDITAEITNLNGIDLDVFILSACNPANCMAVGNTIATLNNAPAGLYYIVVDGYNGASGSFTLAVSCASTPPQAPLLTFPANNSYQPTTAIQFQWTPTANLYEFQLAYDNAFTNIFSTSSTVYGEQISIPSLPNSGTVFYWRVRGYNNAGWGNWSQVFSFTNGQQPQSQNPTFIKYYGVSNQSETWMNKLLQDVSGNYYIYGVNPDVILPNTVAYFVKTDAAGELLWSKQYNLSGYDFNDLSYNIKATSDGGFIVATTFYIDATNIPLVLMKLDGAGTVQWSKRYDIPSGINALYPFQISQTSDGGYFISGSSPSGIGVGFWMKTDGSGNISWIKSSNFGASDDLYDHVVNSNGFLLLTNVAIGSDFNIAVAQVDNSGNILWAKSYLNTYGPGRIVNFNGDYLISGVKQTGTNQTEGCFIKIDNSGTVLWSKAYDISGYQELNRPDIAVTNDGGFVMLTNFDNSNMPNRMLYIKFDLNGNLVWENGLNSQYALGGTIISTLDGGIAACGSSSPNNSVKSDFMLVKIDPNNGSTFCNNFNTYNVSSDANFSSSNATYTATTSNLTVNTSALSITATSTGVETVVCAELGVAGNVHTKTNAPINSVDVEITGGSACSYTTSTDGNYQCNSLVSNSNCVITPAKDGLDDNGVTVQDLVLIQQDISGVLPFNDPYSIIAADINGSGSVDNTDLNILQQFRLGQITTLPINSWQFVPASYVFPNPNNPFPYPHSIQLNNLTTTTSNQNFIGIKVGDVDNDVDPSRDNSQEAVKIVINDYSLAEGTAVSLPLLIQNFKMRRGLQFQLFVDPNYIELTGAQTADISSISSSNFGLVNSSNGELRFLWYEPNGQITSIAGGKSIFNLNFVVKRPIDKLSDVISIQLSSLKAEAVNGNYTCSPVELKFEKTALEYTGIDDMKKDQGNYVLIVPNPAHNSAVLHLNSTYASNGVLRLLDSKGAVIVSRNIKIDEGYNKIDLTETSSLAGGVYLCSVILPNSVINAKFVKY